MTSSTTYHTTTTTDLGSVDPAEPRFLSKVWRGNRIKLLLLCTIDVWNLYLHFRQLEFIMSGAEVPEVLTSVISSSEFSSSRRQAAFFILLSIFSISGRLHSHTFSVSDGYAPLIWTYTSYYTSNMESRAVIYSALEDFTSKVIVVPIIVFLSIFHKGSKVSPLGVALAGTVWLAGSAMTCALRTFTLTKATAWYGSNFFLYYGLFNQAVILLGHKVFIQILAPFFMQELPEGPAKSSIDKVASSAGYYPKHTVYFEANAEGRPDVDPNAYHAGILGSSMIVISESLLNIVGPNDIGAVVGHELGHWNYCHSAYSFAINAIVNLCFMVSSIWAYGNDEVYDMFHFKPNDRPHPIVGVLLIRKYFLPILGGFLMGFRGVVGYFCEFAADGFAVKLGLGAELRRSLVNLVGKIKVFPGVDSWYAAWFRGHPSMVLRIESLQ